MLFISQQIRISIVVSQNALSNESIWTKTYISKDKKFVGIRQSFIDTNISIGERQTVFAREMIVSCAFEQLDQEACFPTSRQYRPS